MKATINEDFLTLFLYDSDIDEYNCVEIDNDYLTKFNVGDEVEILKELDIGTFSKSYKSYVIYNPKNHESLTIAEVFLKFN